MADVILETERLILREIIAEDLARMYLLDSNPEVMKYIGIKPLTMIQESVETIKKFRRQYRENSIGRWAVIEKSTNLLIGWNGLKYLTEPINGFKNVYEIGYRFLPEFWGKGYATESGKAVLDYGFNIMKVEIVYACADIENTNSNKILNHKLGFEKTGTFVDELDGATCFWYELKKENFK